MSNHYYEPNKTGHLVHRPHGLPDSLIHSSGCPRCDKEELEFWDRDPAETCWASQERRASLSAPQQTDDLIHLWSLKGSPKLEASLWSPTTCARRVTNDEATHVRGTLNDPVALDISNTHPIRRTKSPTQASLPGMKENLAPKEVVAELNELHLPKLLSQPCSQEQIRHDGVIAAVVGVKMCDVHGEYKSYPSGFSEDWQKL